MSPPVQLAEPPAQGAPTAQIRIVSRDGAGEIHLDWTIERIEQALHDPRGTLWVDIENPDGASTSEIETLLREVFGFHPLAIEDAIQDSHIPKVDDWGDYL